MRDVDSFRELLYQYEILNTRLEIREHFLRTAVRDVYENIGQALALIRVQLSALRSDFQIEGKEKIDSSGQLVGKTIRDLRNMTRSFYPEKEMTNGYAFTRIVEQEIKSKYPGADFSLKGEKMVPETIKEENGLVLLSLLLKMVQLIGNKNEDRLQSFVLKFTRNKVHIVITYLGQPIIVDKGTVPANPFELSFFQKAELIGGNLQLKNIEDEWQRIKLVIPIN